MLVGPNFQYPTDYPLMAIHKALLRTWSRIARTACPSRKREYLDNEAPLRAP